MRMKFAVFISNRGISTLCHRRIKMFEEAKNASWSQVEGSRGYGK